MHNRRAKVFVMSFIILFISITALNYVCAKNNEVTDNFEVTITSDAKELNDTHKIKFEVEESPNVISNRLAPGMKATAEIEINLEKVEGFFDIDIRVDESKLENVFILNAKLDEESVNSGKISKIRAGGKKLVKLELIWNGNDIEDTTIGRDINSIEIPVEIKVLQHI